MTCRPRLALRFRGRDTATDSRPRFASPAAFAALRSTTPPLYGAGTPGFPTRLVASALPLSGTVPGRVSPAWDHPATACRPASSRRARQQRARTADRATVWLRPAAHLDTSGSRRTRRPGARPAVERSRRASVPVLRPVLTSGHRVARPRSPAPPTDYLSTTRKLARQRLATWTPNGWQS